MKIKSLIILAMGLISSSAFAQLNNGNPGVIVVAPPGTGTPTTPPATAPCVKLEGLVWKVIPCPAVVINTPVSYKHTIGVRGWKDQYLNPKKLTFYIVGRQGGISVKVPFDNSTYTAMGQLNPISLDQLTPLQRANPAAGNLVSTQPSPLQNVNERVDQLNGYLPKLVNYSTKTFPYSLNFTYSTLPNGYSIPNGDQPWRYKQGEVLAYLQAWATDSTGKLVGLAYKAPCALTSEFAVGQSVHLHYKINTNTPVTYSCYIDVY